jgi:Chromo (CHRromatin Organisation MOdifier) domain
MNGKLLYKIRWKNYKPVDDTWEECDSLNCPNLLEVYNIKVSGIESIANPFAHMSISSTT